MPKKRLDQLLVDRGLAASRQRAQSMIMAGQVLVNDSPQVKAGQQVEEDADIRLRSPDHPYVSRGGLKLAAALDQFRIDVKGKIALDVGASTGGFTHVLLLRDILKVHAIDVGHNQMDWKIRSDPRVIAKEKVNARYLAFEEIGEKVDLIVVDISFISLEKVIPSLLQFSHSETNWITLIKPQFEVGREKVGKGGIVQSEEDRIGVIEQLTSFGKLHHLTRIHVMDSPILGTDGNKEFLAHWKLEK